MQRRIALRQVNQRNALMLEQSGVPIDISRESEAVPEEVFTKKKAAP